MSEKAETVNISLNQMTLNRAVSVLCNILYAGSPHAVHSLFISYILYYTLILKKNMKFKRCFIDQICDALCWFGP